MPLTNKEKMARRQAKIAANPDKRAEYLKSERERKKKERDMLKKSMSSHQLKKFKAKESARVKTYYKKKRQEKAAAMNVSEDADPVTRCSAYKSKCTFKKAVYKATRNLPVSPRKKQAVVSSLAKACGLELSPHSLPRKTDSSLCLDKKTLTWVEDFYHNDEISWQAPGQKDRLIVRSKNCDGGQVIKTHVQLRYMLMSLKEAYEEFRKNYSDAKIGVSKFASLRPEHILPFDKIPHNVCVCLYHENIRLILEALKSHTNFSTEFSTFVEQIVCSASNKDCMYSECSICANKIFSFRPLTDIEHTPTKYYQWQKSGKISKVEILSTVKETFGELLRQVKKFLLHTYIKREQASAFDQLKSSVNTENVVIQVDFAENAAILNQNEIQSAHWVHSQATIFPAHAWISKNESQSFAILSDMLDHTKLTVYKFLSFLLKYLKNQYPTIKNVQVFSDGPSSQFKQRFLFSNLFLFDQENSINITWNFFATSHGKGVVDGIGGTIKRTVWRHIKAGKAFVSTPEEYASVASLLIPHVHIKYIPSEDIMYNSEALHQYWKKILPVPNIHSVHCVKAISANEIVISDTSLSDTLKTVILFAKESDSECDSDESKNMVASNLKQNDWVVVNYESAHFPGCITQINGQEIEVSVMHRAEGYFKWPKDEDKIFYIKENILKKISPPIPIGNRGQFAFNDNI